VAGFLLMCILACAVLPAAWLHHNALYDLTMTQPHSLGTVLSQPAQATQHHHRLKVNKQPPAQFEQDSDSEDEKEHSQEDSQDDEKSVHIGMKNAKDSERNVLDEPSEDEHTPSKRHNNRTSSELKEKNATLRKGKNIQKGNTSMW
jgi:E3 ubiquitin-protein ligase DOA10